MRFALNVGFVESGTDEGCGEGLIEGDFEGFGAAWKGYYVTFSLDESAGCLGEGGMRRTESYPGVGSPRPITRPRLILLPSGIENRSRPTSSGVRPEKESIPCRWL